VREINTKGLDFRHKEVININNAKRMGFVQDVNADLATGTITSIIVPGNSNKLFGIFSSSNDVTIPWENITCIGDDIILVKY
jgi:YlmC/YmxH family sporulation protein